MCLFNTKNFDGLWRCVCQRLYYVHMHGCACAGLRWRKTHLRNVPVKTVKSVACFAPLDMLQLRCQVYQCNLQVF